MSIDLAYPKIQASTASAPISIVTFLLIDATAPYSPTSARNTRVQRLLKLLQKTSRRTPPKQKWSWNTSSSS